MAHLLSLLAAVVVLSEAAVHYPPTQSNVNNLTFVLNGTGAPGIFNSSTTPDKSYGEYNWCNMPHVREREYKTPSKEFTLEYVEVIHRHHKRTPYASNTFFKEDIPWNCPGEGPVEYGKGPSGVSADVTEIQWKAFQDAQNPFVNSVGPGFVNSDCQFPQITADGIVDSNTHGTDLRSVYATRLGLGGQLDTSTVQIRVTNNDITSQVAGGLLKGLFPGTDNAAVLIQSGTYDSLEPTYSCPTANSLFSSYTSNSANWTTHLADAASLYAKLDSVSGIATQDSAGWHTSFDHYYDNLSAKLCHQKTLPCSVNDTSLCVTQDEVNTVFRLGNWEYSYYYRDAPQSTQYSALHYGAWFLELQSHLQAVISGQSKIKYFHNIAHDGSVSPVLGFLQIANMVWPGMGAEVVFELYKNESRAYFIRVLWGGQPMVTSTPMGTLDMIPIQTFLDYIETNIGSGADLFNACN
ncbi:phosphoglycerate mutase-like protein [Roridomyces roridus]|uniref:Phosphoglycerate mutase-like protein n=1 Tax=Roridomyces roridus TaxID=1738132 RepID=A0AAD7BVZ6_9AGAR|nr:phosphoglycerate mutase-like protein [Roridomyces roridus]